MLTCKAGAERPLPFGTRSKYQRVTGRRKKHAATAASRGFPATARLLLLIFYVLHTNENAVCYVKCIICTLSDRLIAQIGFAFLIWALNSVTISLINHEYILIDTYDIH